MANLHGTFQAGRAFRPHSPAIISPSASPIDGKCGALFEWQGWLLVWCGVVCARLRLDRGRSRFRVQGLERITYRAVYVLFLLPVSHQTYSQARAEPALIAADDIRSLRILLPKRLGGAWDHF